MKAHKQHGFALIGVLWGTMILSLALGAVTTMMRGLSQDGQLALQKMQAVALADAGVDLALYGLLSSNATQWPRRDGTPFKMDFQGKTLEISVQDEGGKVDINAAPGEVLKKTLVYVGLSPEAAQTEADRIQDWREPGDLRRLNGAKANDYAEAGVQYRPRGDFFESIGEVGLVLGMSVETTRRLLPLITVYSEQPSIDETTAPRPVLEALSGLDENAIEQLLAARTNSGGNALGYSPAGFASLAGHAFRITVRVIGGGYDAPREFVIRLSGSLHNPVWTYAVE